MFNNVKLHTKLIGFYDEFNLIKNFFNDRQKSNKLLFSGLKGIGKATFAYHLINYAFSLNEDYKYDVKNNTINTKNRSYKLIENNTHPNLFNVSFKENKSIIDISKIREMIEFSNKSSFNNDIKIILIDNVEFLNKSASNSLLKVMEDDNSKLFFILIQNSRKTILETIKSRCVKFNLKLDKKYRNEILNIFIKKNDLQLINNDFFDYYSSPGDLIKLYNFCSDNKVDLSDKSIEDFLKIIINDKSLINNPYIKENISNFIELYFYKNFFYNKNNLKYNYLHYSIIKKLSLLKTFNLDFESFLLNFSNTVLNE